MAAIKTEHRSSGDERASMRRCWELLDLTGRTFTNAIRDIDGDLARALCIYYLVLRGLDTVEDDMTLPNDVKQSLLRSFHIHTVTPGWNFEGSGPNEKDRILLVEYHNVVEELNLLPIEYKSIILDVTQKMDVGMADYAQAASEKNLSIFLTTIANYDQYCHYVGGIVGASLPRTFAVSGKEPAGTDLYDELGHSWACFIQKADLIHDYREDVDQKRYLWPQEIWSRKEYGFSTLCELYEAVEADGDGERSEMSKKALYVQSEMVLDALRHAIDALDYLAAVKYQGLRTASSRMLCVSIANIELCFMNRELFLREVKFKHGEFEKFISSSPTVHETATTFRDYARKIQARAEVSDPNLLRINIACEKIEQWYEYHYPSHGRGARLDIGNANKRTPIPHMETEDDLRLARENRLRSLADCNSLPTGIQMQAVA